MTTKSGAQRTTSERDTPSPGSAPSAAASNSRRIESLVGNLAIQRFVQASLRVGRADDPHEEEADRVASAIASPSCGGCSSAAPCAACGDHRPRIMRKTSTATASNASWLPASSLARLTGGAPLDSFTRGRMQQHFGRDFARVRVHTGADAAESARAIDARAFTSGPDIVFDRNEYRPGTAEGDRLIAHELTHVVQNEGEQAPVRRVVGGDIRTMGITASWAQKLTDVELEQQVAIVRTELTTKPHDSSEYQSATENLQVLEVEVRRRSGGKEPEGAPEDVPSQIAVGLTYELVGVKGAGGKGQQIPPSVLSALSSFAGGTKTGAGGANAAFTYAGVGGAGPASRVFSSSEPGAEQFLGGSSSAAGIGLLRFLDPLPGGTSPLRFFFAQPAGPGANMFTRFAGPESLEALVTPPRWNLGGDLRPRWGLGSSNDLLKAEQIFKSEGISYRQLADLREALQKKGFGGLTAEESALFRQVTRVHAEISGATPRSPLLSLTKLRPEEALDLFNQPAASGGKGIGTVTQRSYIVRVRIDPKSVAEVNEVLGRAAPGSRLASELEVVVAEGLSTGSETATIVSITRNPSPVAPLGGGMGGALTWVGRGLVVLGAAITIAEVVTAEGKHRRQTELRAFGSFAGGTMLGAFGAGFCIGAGIATGGLALLLCAGGFALAGSFAGGALGDVTGSALDKLESGQ